MYDVLFDLLLGGIFTTKSAQRTPESDACLESLSIQVSCVETFDWKPNNEDTSRKSWE